MYRRGELEMRVLVLTPTGRDAMLVESTLAPIHISTAVCQNPASLLAMLEEGAAAAIVAEEAVSLLDVNGLTQWLTAQPPWSDMPFVVLTSGGRASVKTARRAQELQALGNVTFLERPVRPETVQTALRAALRVRMRQYEMRQRQESLIRVNMDLEQFAYSASHDLQEPIRNISIYSDLLNRRYGRLLDDNAQEFLSYVTAGAKRMEMLVRDLLAYTQAASITDETPEPVDMKKPLAAALFNLAETVRQNEAQIVYSSLPAVRMREVHQQQLLQNLIGNAIKYRRKEKPQVSITAQKNGGQWTLAIQDNGIGISPEYKERIFGIFKRLHGNDEYTGTGIGLAICQRIVDRYRGRIWVESKPGKGSTFFFTIPG